MKIEGSHIGAAGVNKFVKGDLPALKIIDLSNFLL
jgi:hypothetical protein